MFYRTVLYSCTVQYQYPGMYNSYTVYSSIGPSSELSSPECGLDTV